MTQRCFNFLWLSKEISGEKYQEFLALILEKNEEHTNTEHKGEESGYYDTLHVPYIAGF